MIIWLAILIPIVASIVLYKKFQHKVLWWEFLIPFAISIVLIATSKLIIETAQTRDTEYWGGWLVEAEYYEDWNERVSCRHPESCDCSNKDGSCSGGHGYEHMYDVDYHPPYWQIMDSNGLVVGVDKNTFESLCKRFNNRSFVDLHRDYHTDDGDKYVANWDKKELTLVPVTTSHSYENRVAVSDSVFNYQEVDPKEFGLFDYPRITHYYQCDAVIGSGDQTQGTANKRLKIYNAKLGRSKQVRMLVVVFKDQPVQAGFDQESYWKGGNKNEFVVTIGVDKENNVSWCHPFSWTEIEELKIETRNHIATQKKLNLEQIVEWLAPQVEKKFQRKPFADFDYLSVEPPMWAVLLTFFLVAGINGGVSFWIIRNQHEEGGRSRFRI